MASNDKPACMNATETTEGPGKANSWSISIDCLTLKETDATRRIVATILS